MGAAIDSINVQSVWHSTVAISNNRIAEFVINVDGCEPYILLCMFATSLSNTNIIFIGGISGGDFGHAHHCSGG